MAHFGEFGLAYFPTVEGYKVYEGQIVEYLPQGNPSYNDKQFVELFNGKFNTPYIIKKISGNDKRVKFEMVEKNNPSSKIKFEFCNYSEFYSYGKNTFANTESYRVPLFFTEKFKESIPEFVGKPLKAQNGSYLTIEDMKLETPNSDVYPYISYVLRNPFTNDSIEVAEFGLSHVTNNLGKTFSNDDGSITITVVDVAPYSFTFRNSLNNKDIVYSPKNYNSSPDDIAKYALKAYERVGEEFSDPDCNYRYKIIDVNVDKDYKGIKTYYIIENSSTGNTEATDDKPEEYCKLNFLKAKKGSYVASLSKVIKPSNASIRYGKTNEVKDKGITKFSYVDNVIDLTIFATSSQFAFELKNLSPNSIKIIWDEAAFVDADGSTSKIMHAGTRYSERTSSQPPTTIISGAKIEDVATPTDRVRYSSALSEWVTDSMFPLTSKLNGKQLRLMLPIQIKNVINEYIFVFDLDYVPNHPELLVNPY